MIKNKRKKVEKMWKLTKTVDKYLNDNLVLFIALWPLILKTPLIIKSYDNYETKKQLTSETFSETLGKIKRRTQRTECALRHVFFNLMLLLTIWKMEVFTDSYEIYNKVWTTQNCTPEHLSPLHIRFLYDRISSLITWLI